MPEGANGGGNVVIDILDSWPRLGKLLLFTLCFAGIVLWVVYLSIKYLPATTSEMQIGIGSSHILVQQSNKDGATSLVVVSPQQGWNRTSIRVRAGETLKIQAGGRVQVDLSSLSKALEARRNAEDRIRKAVKAHPGAEIATEDYFTDDDRKAMLDIWQWSGPDGVPEDLMEKRANKARRERAIMPKQPYGVLIGAFSDRNEEPDHDLGKQLTSSAFRVGSNLERRATDEWSGYLYFTVNDVQYDPVPELFFVDNLVS